MKVFRIAAVLFLVSLSLPGQTPFLTLPAPKSVLRVALVPAENVTASDIDVVKRAVESYYGVHVTVTPPVTLAGPAGVKGPPNHVPVLGIRRSQTPVALDNRAWAKGRSQSIRTGAGGRQVVTDSTIWEGNPFIPFTKHAGPDFDVVVGLMGYGLSTGKWTTRGLTTMQGKCSLVTTYLVRQQSATEEQYRFRLAKVALHEFGHALGLPHCGAGDAGVQLPEYSGNTTTVKVGDPRCLMLQSTPDGAQHYATTNQLCAACAGKVRHHVQAVLP